MFATERQREIIELINAKGAAKIGELTERFGVSVETIRRDLLELEKQNSLRRVHGGALRIPRSGEYLDRKERSGKNQEKKAELVRYAAELISESDILMVDCGSTAVEFAGMLRERFERLTIITSCLDVFDALKNKESFELYLCSGFYMGRENAFYGPWVLESLERFHADKAILCPSAVSIQYGIMDYDRELCTIQKMMMARAGETVFLADSDKFEKSGFLKIADMKQDCILVTDSGLEEEIYNLYQENQIRVLRGKKDWPKASRVNF